MKDHDDIRRLSGSASAAIAAHDWPAAARALGELIRLVPGDASVAYNLALVEKQLGRPAEAERRLATVLEIAPGHHKARFEHAALLMDRGAEDDALAQFESYLAAVPDDADALLNAGRLCLRLDRAEAAARLLEEAARLRPDDPAVALARAEAKRDLGLIEEADRAFRDLYARVPALRPAILKAMTQGQRGRVRLDSRRIRPDE